jgi:hypothetical protein
MLTG